MVQSCGEVAHELSLLDQRLNKLKHISTFVSADEYRDIHVRTQSWNSRVPYLTKTIFKPEKVNIDVFEKNKFPIKLFSTVPNHTIYDTVASIPVEFQYIITKEKDLIVLRVDLGDGRYFATTIALNEKTLATIQVLYENILTQFPNMDHSQVFERAYFEYIHKNSIYILSHKKDTYNNWGAFEAAFKRKYKVDLREYNDTGKYLWHRDYILLDNRAMKDFKIYTLKNQWLDIHQEEAEKVETLKSIKPEKNKYFNIGELYMDEKGNYWSSKEAYQMYRKFLDI